jgi:hypothetical protein
MRSARPAVQAEQRQPARRLSLADDPVRRPLRDPRRQSIVQVSPA